MLVTYFITQSLFLQAATEGNHDKPGVTSKEDIFTD
jgi:hypothetical protein